MSEYCQCPGHTEYIKVKNVMAKVDIDKRVVYHGRGEGACGKDFDKSFKGFHLSLIYSFLCGLPPARNPHIEWYEWLPEQ